MKLDDLWRAVESLERPPSNPRADTYLRTYPALLAFGNRCTKDSPSDLYLLACATYGWMPRALKLNATHAAGALNNLKNAIDVKDIKPTTSITELANFVGSVVGASKILHFVNPESWPIWDSKVEGFRTWSNCPHPKSSKSFPAPYSSMNVEGYVSYIDEVFLILEDSRFEDFYAEMQAAHEARLTNLKIEPYEITRIRAIELAAFELA